MNKNIYTQDFFNAYNSETGFDVASLKTIIENSYGEKNELDFKEGIIEENKIAKTILAMTNNGGGTIIFGVNDEGKAVGLNEDDLKDPTDFERKIRLYLPDKLRFHIQMVTYKDDEVYGELSGKNFVIIFSSNQNRYIPFLAKKESTDLKANVVYIRKNTSNEVASNEDLEEMFKLRLLEQYEDLSNMNLEEHIEQLKVLYNSISKTINYSIFQELALKVSSQLVDQRDNKYYPNEEFDEYIAKVIERKKRKIDIILDIVNIE